MRPDLPNLSDDQRQALLLGVARAFSPRAPITARQMFSGRLEQIQQLLSTVAQAGQHAVIYGERGVGKTSLVMTVATLLGAVSTGGANATAGRVIVRVSSTATDTFASVWRRALDEIIYEDDVPGIGFRPVSQRVSGRLRDRFGLGDDLQVDEVRRVLAELPGSVFIIDEFDRIGKRHTSSFTDLVKSLSDYVVDATVLLVGVAATVEALVKDHESVSRAMRQVYMPRMQLEELADILTKAEQAVGIVFEVDGKGWITRLSQGFPHITHLVGQASMETAIMRSSLRVTIDDVRAGLEKAVQNTDHTTKDRYDRAVRSAHSGAIYRHVLLACAFTAAAQGHRLGYFQPASVAEPLADILGRSQVAIASFNSHLGELCEDKREKVLERTGQPRAYRFRFRDPLFVPFVILNGISTSLVNADKADALMRRRTAGSSESL